MSTASAPDAAVTCPVCGGASVIVHKVQADGMRDALARLFGQPVPPAVELIDYNLRRCQDCTLEFATPMLPGNQAFYDWITAAEKYTARKRWEWQVMADLIAVREQPVRVLELGCGVGRFLEQLQELPAVTAVGIDSSATSVAAAKAKGLDVRLESVEATGERGERFDVVVLSHLLEHVGDPLGLMRQVQAVLTPGGTIFCSLPYSPMSREMPSLGVYDPMNLPPHHLTRWNASSFEALAKQLGMNVNLHSPKPKSVLKRTLNIVGESAGASGSVARLAASLSQPGRFMEVRRVLQSRDRIGGRRAGDVVLAVFG